ncbi:MAG: cation transporter [Tepidiformaceae bacterium]
MKTKFEIKGMHCVSCALSIDDKIEALPGVRRAKTSYAKQQTNVDFDAEMASEQMLIAAVKAAGYEATLSSA